MQMLADKRDHFDIGGILSLYPVRNGGLGHAQLHRQFLLRHASEGQKISQILFDILADLAHAGTYFPILILYPQQVLL